jgi:hypothetical protein
MQTRRFDTIFAALLPVTVAAATQQALAQDTFGPENLLKTMPTPFGSPSAQAVNAGSASRLDAASPLGVSPIAMDSRPVRLSPRSLADRLVTSRLYLPGRMVLGKPAEFTVKGRPGSLVALAMADRNSGAKPIYGRTLKLGSDRKVVSVGRIPDSGVLTLTVDTPIQGDLIGQHWFFEAVVWSRPDFSDLNIAVPVTSEGQEGIENGVMVSAESDQKRGLKFVADSPIPLQQRQNSEASRLESGRP